MKKRLVRSIALSVLVLSFGCTYDEIDIDMIPHDAQPSFHFKYVRRQAEPVLLSSIRIKEAATGKTVWELWAFDPSIIFEKEGDKLVPRNPREIQHESVRASAIQKLEFAVVPSGFQQYVPPDGAQPTLVHGVRYTIDVSGGSAGRLEFMVDLACKKVSLTPYTENLPSYMKEDICLDQSRF